MNRIAIIAIALAPFLLPIAGETADGKEACDELLNKETLIWRRGDLESVRDAINDGDPQFDPALAALTARADRALERGPYTVVHKTRTPPSGDRHDYMSMSPYWWPPERGGKGAPYVRRDGEVNPERDGNGYDKVRLRNFMDDVKSLSLAAYFSSDERYANHAELLLRVWFVDAATRMNPNLNFAQGIPGGADGRSFGIIDTADLVEVVDAIALLRIEDMIDAKLEAEVRSWFVEFVHWLTTNPLALKERQARNNHGTHFDAQLMTYALFARNCALAFRVVRDTKIRIGSQIAANGFMPEEVERTRSLHYHVFNLHAFLKVARLAEHIGDNLYAYRAEDGASILSTLSLLAAYAGREKEWPHEQLDESAGQRLWRVLRMAGTAIDAPVLMRAIERSDKQDPRHLVVLLTGSIELTDGI